eukprot:1009382-Pelagomonas_calceolata.AAC.1
MSLAVQDEFGNLIEARERKRRKGAGGGPSPEAARGKKRGRVRVREMKRKKEAGGGLDIKTSQVCRMLRVGGTRGSAGQKMKHTGGRADFRLETQKACCGLRSFAAKQVA